MAVLQLQQLALDLGDFSFHVVDFQKKLMEKQAGMRHVETVLSIAKLCSNCSRVVVTRTNTQSQAFLMLEIIAVKWRPRA